MTANAANTTTGAGSRMVRLSVWLNRSLVTLDLNRPKEDHQPSSLQEGPRKDAQLKYPVPKLGR